jgi:hypothetical protein
MFNKRDDDSDDALNVVSLSELKDTLKTRMTALQKHASLKTDYHTKNDTAKGDRTLQAKLTEKFKKPEDYLNKELHKKYMDYTTGASTVLSLNKLGLDESGESVALSFLTCRRWGT